MGAHQGTGAVAIAVSKLVAGGVRWSASQIVSEDMQRSAQNPVMYFSPATNMVSLIHTSQVIRRHAMITVWR